MSVSPSFWSTRAESTHSLLLLPAVERKVSEQGAPPVPAKRAVRTAPITEAQLDGESLQAFSAQIRRAGLVSLRALWSADRLLEERCQLCVVQIVPAGWLLGQAPSRRTIERLEADPPFVKLAEIALSLATGVSAPWYHWPCSPTPAVRITKLPNRTHIYRL